MVTTIQSELVPETEGLQAVPLPPNASDTKASAFADARDVIARVQAAVMERELMANGYREMAAELHEWSDTTFSAQAEALPNE